MPPLAAALALFAAADLPAPKPTKADEPLAAAYAPGKAAAYLDAVGVGWTRDRKCATCHTNVPYLMARPLLKGDDAGWKEVRAFLEADVAKWATGKPRGDAYVVATAAALAVNDAVTTGKLHPSTRAALDKMWAAQRPAGDWNWLKCGWPPFEHDDYYGAVLAAVAAGTAPGKYAEEPSAKAGLAKLRAFLKKTPPPDPHHKAMLVWASCKLDGLMTTGERAAAVAELRKLQRADGGWSLPTFGTYTRKDGTANAAAASDGYATGFAVFVLRQAGAAADDPAVAKGVAWLKGNQRESGRWFTRSLNNDKAHYVTNAGTAFAVLALEGMPLDKPTVK